MSIFVLRELVIRSSRDIAIAKQHIKQEILQRSE